MPSINSGLHILLTEAVKQTFSENRLTEAVNIKTTASVSSPIFRGIIYKKPASVYIQHLSFSSSLTQSQFSPQPPSTVRI